MTEYHLLLVLWITHGLNPGSRLTVDEDLEASQIACS